MTIFDKMYELDGCSWDDVHEMREDILTFFNKHLELFPPNYSYLTFIDWCTTHKWLKRTDDGKWAYVKRHNSLVYP